MRHRLGTGFDDERGFVEELCNSAAVGNHHGDPRGRGFRRDHAEALALRRQHEDVRVRVQRQRVAARTEHMYPRLARRPFAHALGDAVAVVGPDEDEVRIRQLVRRVQKELDPFAGGDSADV